MSHDERAASWAASYIRVAGGWLSGRRLTNALVTAYMAGAGEQYRDWSRQHLTTQGETRQMQTSITITVTDDTDGVMVSAKTSGDYASEVINQRFYSYPVAPPADIPPLYFWAKVLADIASFYDQD